ncbi:MAG TPA: tRNA (adenosine(37)-N6)-threonylcarbamoyltransferase complex ATPase subunit type 1 TsaE [Flavobacteriales bacterium]|jgi:tRNA threonylcarbamoyladenosine biosynthesis protein TsaE|nr:tRNA (adenosine(37)-N6)-threonylcarbamoyltransferase complex ATPase subunit type 1 TsaE [Flavobacteriales bacterium]|tara:strand:- start:1755 stop:2249 length:495 start_codon:yes stop_codon:yes gene_type:complete
MTTPTKQQRVFDSDWYSLEGLDAVAVRLHEAFKQVLTPLGHGGYSGVVALHGPMGAGKTTLVNALCQIWGVNGETASATFGLVNAYKAGEWPIFHHDLYRLSGEEEAWDLGLSEYFEADGLNLVEWPERAPGLMPPDALLLELLVEDTLDSPGRRAILWQVQAS